MQATNRVTSAPELLRLLFEYSSREDNIQNAAVCRTWSEVSLDVLWHDVDELRAFFNTLSPIIKKKYINSKITSGISYGYVRPSVLSKCSTDTFVGF